MAYKIFPAWITPQGHKVPIFKGWLEAATDDSAVINKWHEEYKSLGDRLLWGIPCGSVNGIYALDVDVKVDPKTGLSGWDSIKKLQDEGHQIPVTQSQRTRSGGAHFVFKYDPSLDLSQTVKFLPGLDTRGEGGWIAHYGLDQNEVKEIPTWLIQKIKDRSTAVKNNIEGQTYVINTDWALSTLKNCCEDIINAAQGESNNILNIKSYEIGQIVAGGGLTRELAEEELFKAAKLRGKPDYEAKATIKSGLDSGFKNPLRCPFKDVPVIQGVSFEKPEPVDWTPPKLTVFDLKNTSKLKKPQLHKDWSTEDITVVTADGGTGKSTLEMEEAIALALGDPFLGFENVQRGNTLFITGEDSAAKLAAVCGAILRQKGLLAEDDISKSKVNTILESIYIKKDADMCLVTKNRQGFLVMDKEAVDKIVKAAIKIKAKKIVFDPIASFWGSESATNDMAKAVSKAFGLIQEQTNAQIVAINHMGKQSSGNKDMSQFAGRGGTGLPSHARVNRTMRGIDAEEYIEIMGKPLDEGTSAILCNVNKFSDGSPIYNKPFIIIRNGYCFTKPITPVHSEKKLEESVDLSDKIMDFVRAVRAKGLFPTKSAIIGHFILGKSKIPQTRVNFTLNLLCLTGHMGEKLEMIRNPDEQNPEKAYVIKDIETGEEVI